MTSPSSPQTQERHRVRLKDLPALGFGPRPLTPSRAALALELYPSLTDWHDANEYNHINSFLDAAFMATGRGRILPMVSPPDPSRPRRDDRPFPPAIKADSEDEVDVDGSSKGRQITRVYTDMDAPRIAVKRPDIEWTDSGKDADVWLVQEPMSNFLDLRSNLKVCQFPYEGVFVRKDLLPLAVRRFCHRPMPGDTQCAPTWWLPCFDMSTEFHLFTREFRRREEEGLDNYWILKPAVGSHGANHRIIKSIQEAARIVLEDDNRRGGRVAQLLVSSPLCALTREDHRFLYEKGGGIIDKEVSAKIKRKLDLRVFVLIQSFVPETKIYRHSYLYARLAHSPYDRSNLSDESVQITSAVADSFEHRSRSQPIVELREDDGQIRLLWDELLKMMENERPGFNGDMVLKEIDNMLLDLFSNVGPVIVGGPWPRCSAYYGCDVILDDSRFAETGNPADLPRAKLVEVNFMAGWEVSLLAAKQAGRENISAQWAEDMLGGLALGEDLTQNPRFTRLRNRR